MQVPQAAGTPFVVCVPPPSARAEVVEIAVSAEAAPGLEDMSCPSPTGRRMDTGVPGAHPPIRARDRSLRQTGGRCVSADLRRPPISAGMRRLAGRPPPPTGLAGPPTPLVRGRRPQWEATLSLQVWAEFDQHRTKVAWIDQIYGPMLARRFAHETVNSSVFSESANIGKPWADLVWAKASQVVGVGKIGSWTTLVCLHSGRSRRLAGAAQKERKGGQGDPQRRAEGKERSKYRAKHGPHRPKVGQSWLEFGQLWAECGLMLPHVAHVWPIWTTPSKQLANFGRVWSKSCEIWAPIWMGGGQMRPRERHVGSTWTACERPGIGAILGAER